MAPGTPVATTVGPATPSSPDGPMACEALVMVTAAALEPVVAGDGATRSEIDAMRAEWWRWAPVQFRDDVAAVEEVVADHLHALTELHEAAALDGRRPDEHAVRTELSRGEQAVAEAVGAISRWLDDHCFGHAP